MQATKREILDAATRVVFREGVSGLTLEAVAREAGLSKGGLLYHYPSKEALIGGVLECYLEEFEDELERRAGEGPGSWTRAYVEATFEETFSDAEREINAGMLAAMLLNPELLEPLRERYAAWQERAANDGIEPALALILQLAADGLWLGALLGLVRLDGEKRERVLKKMLELAGGAG